MSKWKKDGMQVFVVRLPEPLHAAVKARAESEERSMAQIVRFALRQYVDGAS